MNESLITYKQYAELMPVIIQEREALVLQVGLRAAYIPNIITADAPSTFQSCLENWNIVSFNNTTKSTNPEK